MDASVKQYWGKKLSAISYQPSALLRRLRRWSALYKNCAGTVADLAGGLRGVGL
jgi:hypothetical protein